MEDNGSWRQERLVPSPGKVHRQPAQHVCPLAALSPPSLQMPPTRVLRHVARQLRHLDVALQVALEAGKHDLTLAGLEAVHHAGDGALQVGA